MEKKSEKECVCIYIYIFFFFSESLCCIPEINIVNQLYFNRVKVQELFSFKVKK